MPTNFFQATVLKTHVVSRTAEIDAAYETYKKYFLNEQTQKTIREHKEEEYKPEFIRRLFVEVLGYTRSFDSPDDYNLRVEQKNETDQKKADAAILVNDDVRGVIEIKDMRTLDLGRVQEQAFGYKNNHKNARYVITTNFEKLRFYIDYAGEYLEWNLFTLTRENFASLWVCLAWNSIQYDIPKRLKTESISREEEITRNFYAHYQAFKDDLFDNLIELNPDRDKLTLFQAAQVILNRVVFIRFVEDRGLLLSNFTEKQIIKGWETIYAELGDQYPFFRHLQTYFERLNKGYTYREIEIFGFNGGLFEKDSILEGLEISDEVLRTHLHALCQYNFNSDVDVNILGHIFEHSLSEIESIKNELAGGQPIAPQDSQRKKEGIFYTPKYITKYIIEQTIGRLCSAKKQELGINDEWLHAMMEAGATETKKKKGQKKIAYGQDDSRLAVLHQYREYLLSLTICDPACGSGAFLNAAFDFLKDEHQRLDEMASKIIGNPMAFPDVENEILRNNLFGVDLNEEGVLITCLSLWLNTAKKRHKLCFLDKNIKCGNSLVDDASVVGDKAFDWHKEFPQAFSPKEPGTVSPKESRGFDVVIGNPPYYNIQTLGAGSPQAQWIQERYADIWQDKSDILFYFIYKALELSKSEVGYIVSNALLFSDKAVKLRNYILQDGRLSKIVNFEQFMVFPDASITTGMFIFSGGTCPPLEEINKRGSSPLAKTINAIVLKDKNHDEDDITKIINDENNVFTVELKENQVFALVPGTIAALNQKIDGEHNKLAKLCRVGKGMETAANEVFLFNEFPKQFPKKYIKKRIMGEDVHRYLLANTPDYLLYFEDVDSFEDLPLSIQKHLEKHRDKLAGRAEKKRNPKSKWWNYTFPLHKQLYHLPKIWCCYRSKDHAFVLDETGGDYIGLTNATAIFGTNPEYSLKYILALLNSKLLSFRYQSIGKQTGGGVFEYVPNAVGKLPIPKIDLSAQQPFMKLADRMLLLHVQLQEHRREFVDVLPDVFAGVKITDTLERFDEFDFKVFLGEFAKQKIDFPAQKIHDWKKVFNKHRKQPLAIREEIAKTDTEIDWLVYDLYGLTEAEIAVVDSAAPYS